MGRQVFNVSPGRKLRQYSDQICGCAYVFESSLCTHANLYLMLDTASLLIIKVYRFPIRTEIINETRVRTVGNLPVQGR